MVSPTIKIWIEASRPKTLWAAVAPVTMGTALAQSDGMMYWPAAFFALLGAVLIQIGTNYANDYYDYLKGADSEGRLGPQRVTQAGLVKPEVMKRAFITTFALAFAAGIFLMLRGGLPIVAVGLLSIVFGILYTGGPYPLGYHGWGDIIVLIFFGPVAVGGTYYVQALELNEFVMLAGISPGLLSVAILTVNNLRDIDTDKKSGKKTLAVRCGKSFTQFQYIGTVLIACSVPLLLVGMTGEHYYSLAAIGAPFIFLRSILAVFNKNAGASLNKTLADTAKILIIFTMLFSAGWLVG